MNVDTIKLKTPLMVNGEQRSELPYDIDSVTFDQVTSAEARSKSDIAEFKFSTAENDYSFHLALGFSAIMAADPSIDESDLERIKGADLITVMRVGRNFIQASSEPQDDRESESGESSSEGQQESTLTSSTAAPMRSAKGRS